VSENELAMYNASLPTDEQIICQEETRNFIGSRYQVLPNFCLTVQKLKCRQRLAESVFSSGLNGNNDPLAGIEN
jgi:hypothetical protein